MTRIALSEVGEREREIRMLLARFRAGLALRTVPPFGITGEKKRGGGSKWADGGLSLRSACRAVDFL